MTQTPLGRTVRATVSRAGGDMASGRSGGEGDGTAGSDPAADRRSTVRQRGQEGL
jgi:hypothetical protein